MPSPRRSAIVAVLVLIGGFAFAACGRAQPGTALYIGSSRYTEKRIDELVDPVRNAAPDRNPGGLRILAVTTLVLRELSKRAAEEKSVDVPAPNYPSTAQEWRLPEDSELNHAIADFNALAGVLVRNVDPVAPTDKDLKEIYEALLSAGQFQEGDTYDDIAERMRSDTLLPQVLGLRNLLRDQAEKLGVEVNPRYRPLVTTFGGGVPVVLSEGIGVVTQI
jgi:hypothetical protein